MIAVPTFRAYAMTRPNGWPAGWYDGTFADDGVRLSVNGEELLHLPPGTPGVRAVGPDLTLPVSGGELKIRVQPPAPTNPTEFALAVAFKLTGQTVAERRALREYGGVRWWLALLIVSPVLAEVFVYLVVRQRVFLVSGLAVAINCAVGTNRRWTPHDRAFAVLLVTAVATGLMLADVYLRLLPR